MRYLPLLLLAGCLSTEWEVVGAPGPAWKADAERLVQAARLVTRNRGQLPHGGTIRIVHGTGPICQWAYSPDMALRASGCNGPRVIEVRYLPFESAPFMPYHPALCVTPFEGCALAHELCHAGGVEEADVAACEAEVWRAAR